MKCRLDKGFAPASCRDERELEEKYVSSLVHGMDPPRPALHS